MTPYQMVDIPVDAWIIQTKEEADNILLHGGKIILFTEDVPDYLNSPQYGTSCLMANCLLPNYEAVSYYIEGDPQSFARIHNEILGLPESTIYFATIISAMTNNIPLGFIFGTEEIEQAATINILNFFAVVYGIHLGHNFPFANENPNPTGWMDRGYVANNMAILYQNNLLTPLEFLYVFPIDTRIDPMSIQKLLFELRPPIHNPNDFNEVEMYFNEYRGAIRKKNRMLCDPMVMS